MATRTLGTTAQTSLTAVLYLPGYASGILAADQAAICNAIKDDINVAHPLLAGAFTQGQLIIPNRGVLTPLPGDFIGVSSRGFPYLVSKDDIANGNWVHT